MKIELLLEAFDKDVSVRRPGSCLISHSDKGGQYTAKKFRRRLNLGGFKQSMTGINPTIELGSLFLGLLITGTIREKFSLAYVQKFRAILDS